MVVKLAALFGDQYVDNQVLAKKADGCKRGSKERKS